MLLDIATASSRNQVTWRNQKVSWPDLAARLSRTVRTHETMAAYLAMDKSRQDEVKDVGGFVGGYLNEGRRRKGAVRHRQLLTLDADSIDGEFWEAFTLVYGEAAVLYSTHKHSVDSPRVRLVMPLSRPVTPEEYEAIGRRVAGDVNIEWFDRTTFQDYRLMYWPSTPKDGDWWFERQEGAWLDADKVLERYVNWKDMSEWPMHEGTKVSIGREGKRQGEPTEKPGTVGAFCRAFSISEAIMRFLPDTYESTVHEDRYTFTGGSTASGAVVYEDKFLFSHHSTDPAGGMLLNAFDLVRVHQFGGLDTQKDRQGAITDMPSYKQMCEWAVGLPEVLEELDEMRELKAMAREINTTETEHEPVQPEPEDADSGDQDSGDVSAEVDFAELFGLKEAEAESEGVTEEPAVQVNWKQRLERNKQTGDVKPTIANLRLIMSNDTELVGKIALNEFENFVYLMGKPPWLEKSTDGKKKEVVTYPRRWQDSDDAGLREYIENKYLVYNVGKTTDAMVLTAVKNRFHPIRTYLDGLEWDGVPRLDTLFIDYLGAEDTPYVRAVTRKSFSAAVARVYRPGCKFDYVLTLVGPEGIKKSGLLTEMGSPWFSDSFQTVTGKEAYEQLQGSWIIEIAELSAFNRAETNAIKAFVTKREDKYRAAYGKHVQSWPRQSVFFATTNEPTFLKGHTGNRRFWPVAVTKRHEPKAKLVNDINSKREVIVGLPVDQLWAEAKYRYKEGEPLYLENMDIEMEAKAAQDTYSEIDERVGIVLKYLETPLPKNWDEMDRGERRSYLWDTDEIKAQGVWYRNEVCPMEVWCEGLGMDFRDFNPAKGRELRAIMNMVPGWKFVGGLKTFTHYGRQRYFERTDKRETVKQ